jgi:hypothetical protein
MLITNKFVMFRTDITIDLVMYQTHQGFFLGKGEDAGREGKKYT